MIQQHRDGERGRGQYDRTDVGVGLGERKPGPPQPHPPRAPSPQPPKEPPRRAPPRRVEHVYRDYSNYPLCELPTKKAPTNFPSKLHQILSSHAYSHIISWMPHGRAWKIHNKGLLVQEVIGKYFVQSKYESFTRQLNGWGFKRLHQSGNDFNAYYHPCFLRGLPRLTVLMKRVKPNLGKLLPHAEAEPNFYEIDKQYPLPNSTMSYHGHNHPSLPNPAMISTPSMMPYHGHHHHPSLPHMANMSYSVPPEPPLQASPTGYYSHYSSCPSNAPYLLPYPGHHDRIHAESHCASQSQPSHPPYPPYPMENGPPYSHHPMENGPPYSHHPMENGPPCNHHPMENSHLPSNHRPFYHDHPYAPYGPPSYNGNSGVDTRGHEKIGDVPSTTGAVQDVREPIVDQVYPELLSVFADEPDNASSEYKESK